MAIDDDPSDDLGVVMAARKAKLRASLFGEVMAAPRFDRYVILGTLGRGGMGSVLEAFDPKLDRRVALKLLHRDLPERDTQRLLREAQALARLSHPNVVQVYEVSERSGQTFVTMELVRGQTLHAWANQEPRPDWRACVEVYLQAAAGLAAAHAKGLVHRDFKPSNAIVDDQGHVRVLDFGLVRKCDQAEAGETSRERPPLAASSDKPALNLRLTSTGAVVGTPGYMSPEQQYGHRVDARSDQYSFCVALCEALYGERPLDEPSPGASQAGSVKPAPRGSAVPAELRQVLLRGLSSDPAKRWPSMLALQTELRRQLAPHLRARLGLGLALGLVLVLAAVGASAAYFAPEDGARGAEAVDGEDRSAGIWSGIWDDARKEALREAILSTRTPYAIDTWTRVKARLDAYVQEWGAKHRALLVGSTRATEPADDVMALRLRCLSRARTAVRAAVGVLSNADAEWVSRAIELVEGLPALSSCDDVERLTGSEAPRPADPELEALVEEQRERLADADALSLVGDHAGSEAVAEAITTRAEVLGHGPLLADALLRRGRARHGRGGLAAAEQDLEQAHLLAIAHQHHDTALQTAAALATVVGHEPARADEGRRWASIAMALSRRPSTNDRLRSAVLAELGLVHRRRGELPRALERLEQALAIAEAYGGPEHPDVSRLEHQIGEVLAALGRREQALEHLRRALDLRREALGDHHPEVAQTLEAIAAIEGAETLSGR